MKQRTKALLAAVISGAAFAGLVGGLILLLGIKILYDGVMGVFFTGAA